MHSMPKKQKPFICDKIAPSKKSSWREREVHHIPRICFGSSPPYVSGCYETSVTSNRKQTNNIFRLPKGRQGNHQRCSKPTVGEMSLNLSDRQIFEENAPRKSQRNANDLMLICQKVEKIKLIQRNPSWHKEKPSLLRFTVPAFPAREEFVFRTRHGHIGHGARHISSDDVKFKILARTRYFLQP